MRAMLLLACLAACSSPKHPIPESAAPKVAPAPAHAGPTVEELTVGSTPPDEEVQLYVHVTTPPSAKGTVIVIHGGPGISHEYTMPIEAKLAAAGYRVATYDQRGVGRSSGPVHGDHQEFTQHSDDIEAIRKKLGADKIDLIGHSYGGLMELAYAILHGDHVRSLIFVDSMPPAYGDYMAGQFYFNETMHQLQSEGLVPEKLPEPDSHTGDCSKQLVALLPVYYFDRKHPATKDLAGSKCMSVVFEDVTNANTNYDFTKYLGRITQPTIVFQGEADPFRKQMADQLVAGLTATKAELVMLPKCGHLPWEECPDPFFAKLQAFLAAQP